VAWPGENTRKRTGRASLGRPARWVYRCIPSPGYRRRRISDATEPNASSASVAGSGTSFSGNVSVRPAHRHHRLVRNALDQSHGDQVVVRHRHLAHVAFDLVVAVTVEVPAPPVDTTGRGRAVKHQRRIARGDHEPFRAVRGALGRRRHVQDDLLAALKDTVVQSLRVVRITPVHAVLLPDGVLIRLARHGPDFGHARLADGVVLGTPGAAIERQHGHVEPAVQAVAEKAVALPREQTHSVLGLEPHRRTLAEVIRRAEVVVAVAVEVLRRAHRGGGATAPVRRRRNRIRDGGHNHSVERGAQVARHQAPVGRVEGRVELPEALWRGVTVLPGDDAVLRGTRRAQMNRQRPRGT